jgi:hypothetical protein
MSGFDSQDFQGGIQPGSPDGNAGGNPPADPNAPAGAGSGGDGNQPPADREGWIPRARFDEVNSQTQQLREQIAQLTARDQERQTIGRQLLGQPAGPPEDPTITRLREQLIQVFPELASLRDLQPHLARLPDLIPQTEAQQNAYYQQLGLTHMSALEKVAAPLYGAEKLTDGQKSFLGNQFVQWLGTDKTRQQRYMSGDTSITSEFMTAYQADMLDPFRRHVLAGQQNRAGLVGRLPSRGPATAPIPGARPPQPATEEDRHEAAFAAFVAAGQ